MEKLIKQLLNASDPVAIIEQEVIDLSDYTEIYSDGQWSDCGEIYYWNKKTSSLIVYDWSNWQCERSVYKSVFIKDYLYMGKCLDADHFQRWLKGLKIIFGTCSR